MAPSSSLSTEQQPRRPFLPKPSCSSTSIPSRTALEFLSCLQTDQIMPIHKIHDVVIPTLIDNLSKCNPLDCLPENGHHSPLKVTYEEIRSDLSNIKETLERLKEWEDRLSALTKKLMLYDWEAAAIRTEGTKSVELLQTAIPEIHEMVPTYLWIGEGDFQANEEDLEDVANQLLKDLVDQRFIVPVEEKDIGEFSVCSIMPDTRSALLTIAHNEGFFDFDSDGNPTANSRRAWLLKSEEGSSQQQSMFPDNDKLLTLFNINENCLDFPNNWLSKKKDIAVIHVGNWSSCSTENYIEADYSNFLGDLSDAKHLRCLSLNGISGISKLPDFISTFKELIILDLKSSRDLEKLPKDIGLLSKLTRLDMSGCYLLDEMPKGLALLSELQVLKGFIINRSRKCTKQCTLSDLVNLKKLRKLSLYVDQETTGENGELNCLSEFQSLKILTISWIAPVPTKSKPNKKRNATSPSLPTGLEKLDMRCWPLSTMPRWIKPCELDSLKKLYIRAGKLSSMMQPECCDSSRWKVRILRLKFLKELRTDWQEVRKLFPELVYLERVDCPGLSSFLFKGVKRFETPSTEPDKFRKRRASSF
ncbi:hypothetical protein Vadar_029345 [Vaccinium darrowii]|uniref:Uncharacterized protein n=1 Tax=Vaccinium darrowii TaxID=229202 RepID=A0ACB7ZEK6_9ERIC|nr:hypothetical protein Vadar_029345 [Vaccinium darrowii]